MSKKIAIIGHGIVGKSVERLFQNHYSLVIYDPAETNIYPKKEIDSCDLVIICVPTNPNPDGSCDTSIVEKTISKLKTSLILIKSTIAPGTTDRLSKQTKKHICFSPEYIGESKYYHPYWVEMIETPFLIIGGESQDCEKIINFFEPVMGPTKTYFKCRAIEAEIIKYMENSFFATKVTFVNEFFSICESLKADWHTVREGWLLDTRINRMHTSVFKDNRGFGGKCYPKDVMAIIKASEKSGYSPALLKQVIKSNTLFRDLNKKTIE